MTLRFLAPMALGCLVALGHEAWMLGNWSVLLGLTLACLALPEGRHRAAWFGWALGLGYFAVTFRWIIEPFLVDVARHGWMAPFAIVLMSGGLALFWAVAAWLARFIAPFQPAGILWFAVLLGAMELVRGHIFTGLPWGLVAYTLVGSVWDVWLAWVGSYGSSLLVFCTAGVTAYCLHQSWTWIWPGLIGVFFATLGLQSITPQAPGPSAETTVRLVQPNAPQHQKWDPEWIGVFFDRAVALTAQGDPADLVIWPETSVPALVDYAEPWFEQMALAARGAPVVAGIQRREAGAFYNSAVVLEGPGMVGEVYDKSHLVPFGEYIPFADVLRPLGFGPLVDQVAGFKPGESAGLIQIDGLGLARVLICYEGIFPEEVLPRGTRPDVLLILTNDAWFGTGPGPRQHLVQAQARAIEFGLPVIRAANTGISAVIDARGEITAQLGLNEAGALDASVPAAAPTTFYSQIGDWPLTVLLAVSTLLGVAGRSRFTVDGADTQG